MSKDAAQLLQEALELPQPARAALAASLIESLDEEVDENSEVAWAAEIARRIQEVKDGTVDMIPWAEARRIILHGEDSYRLSRHRGRHRHLPAT